ncbi:melanocyte-stimulating hormone receptor-like [Orbicella faveolata]|uniref:melanocyte-stimulating hormone receptor-like n=1 Tax=Orbicella faveolata TaxID=48498 RepID=UPI0009E4C431|nr:melanocyte-stimulating hormone receptor-like [Orbicella faveolata]
MAMTNVTGGGKHTESFVQQLCSVSLTDGIHDQLISISVLDIFLSITAFLGNTLILVALRKESSLHPPSKLLFSCLATTDLCVGIIAEPLKVCYFMALAQKKWNLCRYVLGTFSVTGYTLSGVSLLTMTAISVDRLLALLLGLRYRRVVALKRTYVVVVMFWIVSILGATSFLKNHLITFWYGCVITLLCVVTSIFSYTKIFLTLRRHQTQVQHHTQQPSQGVPLNSARYRKAVSSALWVQLALAVCYLPYSILAALFSYRRLSSSDLVLWGFATTLVFFNSSLNPFLYCWKIAEVKRAVKTTIREAICCLWS